MKKKKAVDIIDSDILDFWENRYMGRALYPDVCRYLIGCRGLGANEYRVFLLLLGVSRGGVFRLVADLRIKLSRVCFPECLDKTGYEKFSRSFRKLQGVGIVKRVVGGSAKDYMIKQKFD